jgi:hypothetical protein
MNTINIKRVETNCEFCKRKLLIIPYDAKNYKKHFCNMNCRNDYLRINPPRNWLGKHLSKEHNEKLQKGKIESIKKNGTYNQIDLSSNKNIIKEMYKQGKDLRHIATFFKVSANTIMRNMQKWGIKRRMSLRDKCLWKSDDGHIVKSCAEMYIDNWLFHNKIGHIYEKNLGETRFTCDFYIPETNSYIENWGMINFEYARKMKKKLEMYKQLGLMNNLVSIFPKEKIEDKLRFLLSISKIQGNLIQYEK